MTCVCDIYGHSYMLVDETLYDYEKKEALTYDICVHHYEKMQLRPYDYTIVVGIANFYDKKNKLLYQIIMKQYWYDIFKDSDDFKKY